MSWLISIHFYLWRNSLRRWYEQPLSLLSKLVVSALLGALGATVILGVKELGVELDKRLRDRDTLTAVISESVEQKDAIGRLTERGEDHWKILEGESAMFHQAPGFADAENANNVLITAVDEMERLGLVDDFYLVSDTLPVGKRVEFSIRDFRSEATVIRPSEEMEVVLLGRPSVLGSVRRLASLYMRGFSETVVLRAASLDVLRQAAGIVQALKQVEGRRMNLQSNLKILEEIERIREIQTQALLGVTLGASLVLGLVFGSLAWMEFREERYLLALIRSFGVGSLSLLAHSLVENILLAVGGVSLGFLGLAVATRAMNLSALNMEWMLEANRLFAGDGIPLLIGAALGGLLSGIPIAIGLRKPLGLVLT